MNLWPFRWPWNWRRQDEPQADSVADLLLLSRGIGNDSALGAVEAAVAMYGDAAASATMAGRWPLSAGEQRDLVRDYLLRGEALRRIDIVDGRPALVPAVLSDVRATDPNPATWRYLLNVATPSGTIHGEYPAARVLHWRRNPSPDRPWRGRSPLEDAPALAAVAGAVERSLAGEHAVPSARLATMNLAWRQSRAQQPDDVATFPVARLRGDGVVQVQPLDRNIKEASAHGAHRVGAEPDESSVTLRDQLRRDVLAAYGIVPGLVVAESGSAQAVRELRSLWLRGRVLPLLSDLAGVLQVAYADPSVAFTLPLLDQETAETESRQRQRRAMAIASLMGHGLSLDDAASAVDGGAGQG